MRSLATAAMLFALGLLHAEAGHGQVLDESWSGIATEEVQDQLAAPTDLAVPVPVDRVGGEPSYRRVLVGTAVGGVVGAAVGAGVGHLLWGKPRDYTMFPGLDLAFGAVLGTVPGVFVGARRASGGAGHPLATGAAALGGVALGLLVGGSVYDAVYQRDGAKAPAILGVGLGVSISLGVPSFTEWKIGSD